MAVTGQSGKVRRSARRLRSAVGTSAARNARRTLRSRLAAVGVEIGRVAAGDVSSADVHRLRVIVRRATATIDALRPLLPRKVRRWFRRTLRAIRRAAGPVRDLDVIADNLLAEPSAAFLPRALRRRRAAAERRLTSFAGGFRHDAWRRRIALMVDAINGPRSPVRRRLLRRLRTIATRFVKQGDRRIRRSRSIHRIRIAGKKIRYALEAASGIIPVVRGEACERQLRQIQDRFGDVTDRSAIVEALRRWADSESDARTRQCLVVMHEAESRREQKAQRACRRWWTVSKRRRITKVLAQATGRSPA